MEPTNNHNGATPPSSAATKFHIIDPLTGDKHLVREMSDAVLASYYAGIAHQGKEKVKAMITRAQLLTDPLNAGLLIKMIEDAMSNAALLTVLEYEQNRRLNNQPVTVTN